MTKVLFIEGAPAPYRVDFWNELGKRVDLTVWFQAGHEKGRLWNIDGLGANFEYAVLPGRRVGEDKYFNPGITRKLRREPFDACIMSLNCSPTEILAARWLRRRGIPFIFKSDGGFPQRTANPVKEWVKHYLFPKADLWMSSGSNCTQYLLHYGARQEGIIEYPFAVRYDPADLAPLPEAERTKLKAREGLKDIVIFNAGRFIPGKGIEVLLDAFRSVAAANVTLLLIGAGELEENYRAFIREHRIPNVMFLPFMQRDDLITYYKLADLYVFPTFYDTYGLVINEAMMFGLPVIATRMAGAAYDLVRDGENGYLIDADNADQLADRMGRLVRDPMLRARFGRRGRAIIADYTLPHMADRFVDAVERIREMRAARR